MQLGDVDLNARLPKVPVLVGPVVHVAERPRDPPLGLELSLEQQAEVAKPDIAVVEAHLLLAVLVLPVVGVVDEEAEPEAERRVLPVVLVPLELADRLDGVRVAGLRGIVDRGRGRRRGRCALGTRDGRRRQQER